MFLCGIGKSFLFSIIVDLCYFENNFCRGRVDSEGSDLMGRYCEETPSLFLKSFSSQGVSLLYLVDHFDAF